MSNTPPEDGAFAAATADYLQLVSAVHRGDGESYAEVTGQMLRLPAHSLVFLLEAAAQAHLAALAALHGHPEAVQQSLDRSAMVSLDIAKRGD